MSNYTEKKANDRNENSSKIILTNRETLLQKLLFLSRFKTNILEH